MRPLSHQLLALFPPVLALVLVFLFSTPMDSNHFTIAPNVAWLMTLVMVAHYPPAWPRGFAFLLGLLQDFLFGTPLGSQALLTLLLVQVSWVQSMRQTSQLFRLRWLEAAGILVLGHLLLWALMHLVAPGSASLTALLREGFVNALWYPIFYWLLTRLFGALPDVGR